MSTSSQRTPPEFVGTVPGDRPETLAEEIANGVTHGIGVLLGLAGLVALLVAAGPAGDAWRIVSFSVYGATLILLYLASTLYHALPHPKAKKVFQKLDHAAIFLLIAGTYTPFALVPLRGPWGWSLFGVIWGLAAAGVAFKAFGATRWHGAVTALYVAMGWLCLIALPKMIAVLPFGGLFWMAVGGVLYMGGVVFYLWRRLPFGHAVWHLFVLGGSVAHFWAVYRYVLPHPG